MIENISEIAIIVSTCASIVIPIAYLIYNLLPFGKRSTDEIWIRRLKKITYVVALALTYYLSFYPQQEAVHYTLFLAYIFAIETIDLLFNKD